MTIAEAWPIVLMLTLVGLLIGSFLNVVISRVPEGRSVVRPRSACPRCEQPIAPRDNIPVLSWIVLRGKCRNCALPISPLYPAVELSNAVVWCALSWWALVSGGVLLAMLPWLLVLASATLALVVIDFQCHRLPDAIVLPLYPAMVAGLVLAGVLSGEWNVGTAAIGAGIWLVVIGGLWLVSGGRGMGFGDVKLAPVLGATLGWLGWQSAAVGLMAAFILGGVVGIVLLLTRRAGRRTRIPFGPYLVVGTAIGVVYGAQLWDAYLGLAGVQ